MNAIHEFEVAINLKDFKKYTQDWALDFKNYLSNKKNNKLAMKFQNLITLITYRIQDNFFSSLGKKKTLNILKAKELIDYLSQEMKENKAKQLEFKKLCNK